MFKFDHKKLATLLPTEKEMAQAMRDEELAIELEEMGNPEGAKEFREWSRSKRGWEFGWESGS